MAKTVHDNAMVAHIWAQRNPNRDADHGRSSNGNFSFRGPTLYSYTTPIARFYTDAMGRAVVLVSESRYSVTTASKHFGPMWRALDYGRNTKILNVRHVIIGDAGAEYSEAGGYQAYSHHSNNIAALLEDYRKLRERMFNARSIREDEPSYDELNNFAVKVRDYCTTFGLECPLIDVEGDAARIDAEHAERLAARNSSPLRRKRAAEKKEREELAKAQREAERLADIAARAERNAADVAAWQAGETPRITRSLAMKDADGSAFLRVHGDELQTSLGASVPLSHAIRVFQFVRRCKEKREGWKRHAVQASPIRVGHFTVDEVYADGSFTAGCHFISWPHIEKAAIAAGVWEQAVTDAEASSVLNMVQA